MNHCSALKKCSDRNYQQVRTGQLCYGANAICCHDCDNAVVTKSLLNAAESNNNDHGKSIVDANSCFSRDFTTTSGEETEDPLRVDEDDNIRSCWCNHGESGLWQDRSVE